MRILWIVLCLLGAIVPACAQGRLVGVVSATGQEYAQKVLEGCRRMAAEIAPDIHCELFNTSDTGVITSSIETLIQRNETFGLLVQADSSVVAAAARGPIEVAGSRGLSIIGWSTTTLERGALVGAFVRAVVGVAVEDIAVKALDAAQRYELANRPTCVAAGGSVESRTIVESLQSKLTEAQTPIVQGCPLTFQGTSELPALAISVASNDVGLFLVLDFLMPFEADQLQAALPQRSPPTAIISVGADPDQLGYDAMRALYSSVQGETIPSTVNQNPVIQVSTAPYCETCSCTSDDRCKRECTRCK